MPKTVSHIHDIIELHTAIVYNSCCKRDVTYITLKNRLISNEQPKPYDLSHNLFAIPFVGSTRTDFCTWIQSKSVTCTPEYRLFFNNSNKFFLRENDAVFIQSFDKWKNRKSTKVQVASLLSTKIRHVLEKYECLAKTNRDNLTNLLLSINQGSPRSDDYLKSLKNFPKAVCDGSTWQEFKVWVSSKYFISEIVFSIAAVFDEFYDVDDEIYRMAFKKAMSYKSSDVVAVKSSLHRLKQCEKVYEDLRRDILVRTNDVINMYSTITDLIDHDLKEKLENTYHDSDSSMRLVITDKQSVVEWLSKIMLVMNTVHDGNNAFQAKQRVLVSSIREFFKDDIITDDIVAEANKMLLVNNILES